MNDNTPLILAEIKAGKTTRQITAQLGCKDTDVWAIARQHNLRISRTTHEKLAGVIPMRCQVGAGNMTRLPISALNAAGLRAEKVLSFRVDPATHTITITKEM